MCRFSCQLDTKAAAVGQTSHRLARFFQALLNALPAAFNLEPAAAEGAQNGFSVSPKLMPATDSSGKAKHTVNEEGGQMRQDIHVEREAELEVGRAKLSGSHCS